MMDNTSQLDSEELFHLALKATNENKTEASIEYLKRALKLTPENGKALYLLGALHAELGLYDRAVQEITKAVELEPGIDAAHFQLGLLHITSGRLEDAKSAWEVLDSLDNDNPLYLFKTGLLHLANDEFTECLQCLEKGIPLNTINEALNNDMRKIIADVNKATQNSTDAANGPNSKDESKPGGNHVLLSAYQKNDDGTTH